MRNDDFSKYIDLKRFEINDSIYIYIDLFDYFGRENLFICSNIDRNSS